MSAIRVIQFTDPHLFGDAAGTLRGVNTLETLERTLADASGHLATCDAILVTGDLVQDDPAGYAHFRRIFGRFGKPVLCIPGNHDSVPELRAALQGRPFELDGPADIGAWRFVLLDSVVPDQAGGHVSAEMLTKLDEELGRARQRHALVCLHHHPAAMNSRWLDNVGLANANTQKTVSPVDGRVYVERMLATPEQINEILRTARHAQVAWRKVRLPERAQILL